MDEDLTEWFVEKLWAAAETLAADKSMAIFEQKPEKLNSLAELRKAVQAVELPKEDEDD